MTHKFVMQNVAILRHIFQQCATKKKNRHTKKTKLHSKKITIQECRKMCHNILGSKGMLEKCCKVLQTYNTFCVQLKM